ncbi:hypothetical protein D3C80_1945070 [compost metagenome]
MFLRERILFAHIDQRQFFMGQQGPADVLEATGKGSAHGAGFSLDRSQMLGRRALEYPETNGFSLPSARYTARLTAPMLAPYT